MICLRTRNENQCSIVKVQKMAYFKQRVCEFGWVTVVGYSLTKGQCCVIIASVPDISRHFAV